MKSRSYNERAKMREADKLQKKPATNQNLHSPFLSTKVSFSCNNLKLFTFLVFFCVCALHVHAVCIQGQCAGRSCFSPSYVWVPRMELRLHVRSGGPYHWAIWLALVFFSHSFLSWQTIKHLSTQHRWAPEFPKQHSPSTDIEQIT